MRSSSGACALRLELFVQWETAARKIEAAKQEAWRVETLTKEAADLAMLSNKKKVESEKAVQLSEEARRRAT